MGRLLTITAMLVVASVSSGCHSCMQSGYYDPCGGVVYGPSVKAPTFLSGLKKHKHEEHSCPLCNSNAPSTPPGAQAVNGGVDACCQHGHGANWSSTPTYPTPVNYGAAFDQPVHGQHGHSPSCACPSPQNCSTGCSKGKRSQACRGKGQPHCNCSTPITNCNVCDPCPNPCPISNCDTCSTIGDSYSGVVYDGSFDSGTYPSDPMILPGETIIDGEIIHGDTILPETFSSSENCPHCQSSSGPIFQGNIVPGHEHQPTPAYETDKPAGPSPAPAAEAAEPAGPAAEAAPGDTVVPSPEPGPLPASTTMMIPTFPAPKPARPVHWVPNTLK